MHGGDIYRHVIDEDYSVNVNPLGAPDVVTTALANPGSWVKHYPDPDNAEITMLLRRTLALPEEYPILWGNGASEILMAVMQALRPQKVMLPEPSYTGYVHAARAIGAEIVGLPDRYFSQLSFHLKQIVDQDESYLLILTNPGNPLGQRLGETWLMQVLEQAREAGIYVLLDECFITLSDYAFFGRTLEDEGSRYMRLLDRYPNLMILRAMTKTWAIPGLRLGYLISSEEACTEMPDEDGTGTHTVTMSDWIKTQLPEWNISTAAQRAAAEILGSYSWTSQHREAYLTAAGKLIRTGMDVLVPGLRNLGCEVYQSRANYVTFRAPADLFEPMLMRRMLIRDCSDYIGLEPRTYRVAITDEESVQKLLAALGDVIHRR